MHPEILKNMLGRNDTALEHRHAVIPPPPPPSPTFTLECRMETPAHATPLRKHLRSTGMSRGKAQRGDAFVWITAAGCCELRLGFSSWLVTGLPERGRKWAGYVDVATVSDTTIVVPGPTRMVTMDARSARGIQRKARAREYAGSLFFCTTPRPFRKRTTDGSPLT